MCGPGWLVDDISVQALNTIASSIGFLLIINGTKPLMEPILTNTNAFRINTFLAILACAAMPGLEVGGMEVCFLSCQEGKCGSYGWWCLDSTGSCFTLNIARRWSAWRHASHIVQNQLLDFLRAALDHLIDDRASHGEVFSKRLIQQWSET